MSRRVGLRYMMQSMRKVAPAPAAVDLPVTGFVLASDGWTKFGTSPWIDSNDGDASYIQYNTGDVILISYFTFVSTSLPSVSKVELHLIARHTVSGAAMSWRARLWDGSVWVDNGIFTVEFTSWRELIHDVSSILDTVAKVNAARLQFTDPSIIFGGRITYAYLRVWPR